MAATTLREQLALGESLCAAQSDSARLDAELLLCHVLGCSRAALFIDPDRTIEAEQRAQLDALFARRNAGEPVAYLLGEREFWSLTLKVNADVLIPRPATESLVEHALSLPLAAGATVVDLGTGSGAIALALASERPGWQLVGIDRSVPALRLARDNASRHALASRVAWLHSSWLDAIAESSIELVVANPPYIDADDIHLAQGDVRFEPRQALVSADQGTADIARIAQQCARALKPGGVLLVEHGHQQSREVVALCRAAGLVDVDAHNDLAGTPRYVSAHRSP